MAEDNVYAFSSGYLERARHLMPKSAAALPWRHNMDYLADAKDFRERPVDDGVLSFEKAFGRTGAKLRSRKTRHPSEGWGLLRDQDGHDTGLAG